MAGEIANAFITINPVMRGFGSQMVAQMGPQLRSASAQLGTRAGSVLGAEMGGAAAKTALPSLVQINDSVVRANVSSNNWLASTAAMAVKNVALYGSMYAAIQGVQSGLNAAFSAMVGFNAALEQAQIGFTTLLKSSVAAEQQMSWIKSFAKETPFNYQDLVGYSQQLIALGFSAEESRRVLEASGDAAAALGRGSEGIARINLALGQMWTKGRVQSQEMLQLTEAGIGAWQILAEAYGATVEEVQDRVTRGLITAKEAVPALLAGMEAQFGGLMAKQAETFTGVWSNIQDTLQQRFAEAGEPLFNELKAAGQEFLAALDDPAVRELLDGLGKGLAESARALVDAGRAVAAAFKDALPFLRDLWSNARSAMPVLVGLAAGLLAVRRAAQGGLGVGFLTGMVAQAKAASAAVTTVTKSTTEMVAAQRAAWQSSLQLSAAQAAETRASMAAASAAQLAASSRFHPTFGPATAGAAAAAERDLTIATNAQTTANYRLAASEAAVAAATDKAVAASRRSAAVRSTLGRLSGVGQTVGLVAGASSLVALGDAAASTEQKVLGVVGAVGSGIVVGAALGSTILPGIGTAAGAAIGGVVGLTSALLTLNEAQNVANEDTSRTAEVLANIGVTAESVARLLDGLDNTQIEYLGGTEKLALALQQGGDSWDTYAAGIESTIKSLRATAAGTDGVLSAAEALQFEPQLLQAAQMEAALKNLAPAVADVAWNQFLAVQSSNSLTGSFGEQAKAAYESAKALGAIPLPMLQAGVAAEGASGKVGYLLAELTGLPVNTPINFSTNATDIWAKIVRLKEALLSINPSGSMSDPAFQRYLSDFQRLQALQASLTKELTSGVTATQIKLPSYGGGSATQAAQQAATDAARKLEQDRTAQLRFADAFTSIMEAALAGNFDQFRDRLADEIVSLTRDGYQAAADTLRRLSVTLTQASLDYAALTNKINAASSAQAKLTDRMREQYQASVDLVMGLGKVSDAQSFDQLVYLLGETTSAATQYEDILRQLKASGLSEEIWNQLAGAGPESLSLAQSILAQGQSGIDQLNSLSDGLVSAADSMGTLVADSMYQQGIDAMKAYIAGLESQASALETQLVTIANNILTQTAGAITLSSSGYSLISATPTTTANTYDVSLTVNASDFGDLQTIQDFIAMLESQPTTQLVTSAGTVTA